MIRRIANWLFRYSIERSDLLSRLQEASTARTLLQDRLNSVEEEAAQLRDEVTKSHEREVEACHRLEDFLAQRNWGISIHNSAPQIPPKSLLQDPKPVPARGIQGRRLARAVTKQTLREVFRRSLGIAPNDTD